ncbi:MAG: hypothetical protein ABIX01_24210 [Chitinophagaceae bacterium]
MKTFYKSLLPKKNTAKKFSLCIGMLLMFAMVSNATIRRVGFFGSPLAGVDYTTFSAANTASASNDTILVFPGPAVGGDITKKLVIIGTGNWLDGGSTPKGNVNLQAFTGSSTSGQVNFKTGSAGSVISGFDFNGSAIFVGANDVVIKRNRDLQVNLGYNINAGASIPNTINNLQLVENYKLGLVVSYANGFTQTNLNISNNLMAYSNLSVGNNYSGAMSNNIWVYDASLSAALSGGNTTFSSPSGVDLGNGAFLFQNNILCPFSNVSAPSNPNYFGIANGNNTVFNNNMALQTNTPPTWPAGNGNVVTPIANYNLIFEGFPAIGTRSADDRYILKAGSPALTVGAGGTPIGMFAGPSPYKLSTIPSIPTIYQLTSPQGNNPTGSTIQINVSTRGNN